MGKVKLSKSELRLGEEYGSCNDFCDRLGITDGMIRIKADIKDKKNTAFPNFLKNAALPTAKDQ